jgi:hypothetical protein
MRKTKTTDIPSNLPPRTKTINIPAKLHAEIKSICRSERRQIQTIVTDLIETGLKVRAIK